MSTDACYNTDEPWKHYAKSKQSDAKDHILYDIWFHLYEMSRVGESIKTESSLVVAWEEGMGGKEC